MTNTVKKINMIDAVKLFFKNYFNFTGRASRSEYWWFILAYLIVASCHYDSRRSCNGEP